LLKVVCNRVVACVVARLHVSEAWWYIQSAEVFQLIQVWNEEDIQEQLEGAKRNKHIYEQLAEELTVYRIEKTGEQCGTKVKNLCQEYKYC